MRTPTSKNSILTLFYSGACMKILYIHFHENRIINKYFQILTRGAQSLAEKVQSLLLFYSGVCIKRSSSNFHRNRMMNKDFKIYKVSPFQLVKYL